MVSPSFRNLADRIHRLELREEGALNQLVAAEWIEETGVSNAHMAYGQHANGAHMATWCPLNNAVLNRHWF